MKSTRILRCTIVLGLPLLASTVGNFLALGEIILSYGLALRPLFFSEQGVAATFVTIFGIILSGAAVYLYYTLGRNLYVGPLRYIFALACLGSLPVALLLGGNFSSETYAEVAAKNTARSVQISNFKEELVTWPGLTLPVGIHIQFEANFGSEAIRTFEPPIIWMSPAVIDLKDAPRFANLSAHEERAPHDARFLTAGYVNQNLPGALNAKRFFLKSAVERFDFHLFPDDLLSLEPGRVCVQFPKTRQVIDPKRCVRNGLFRSDCPATTIPVSERFVHGGSDLNSNWFSWSRLYNAKLDLSAAFTRTIRQHSSLQGNSETWKEIFRAITPEELLSIGWNECQNELGYTLTNAEIRCFCK